MDLNFRFDFFILLIPFPNFPVPGETGCQISSKTIIVTGCLGQRGLPNDTEHSQLGDHKKPSDFTVEAVLEPVVPDDTEGPVLGQGMVHVPDQHGPDGLPLGLSGGRR